MSDEWPNDGSKAAKRSFKSQNGTGSSHKAPARLGNSGLSLLGASGKWGKKRGDIFMSYSVTIIGFVGADPEQRQARNNGSKFTVLSVATQRSWKNTEDEWASKTEWHRVCVFRPRLAEYVATTIKKGAHVLVEGSLVSTTYERPNGKSKKSATTTKITSWSIRADVVRKLDRGEPEPETAASGSGASGHAPEPSDASPF
jgi:single-strand DNA-binding protein